MPSDCSDSWYLLQLITVQCLSTQPLTVQCLPTQLITVRNSFLYELFRILLYSHIQVKSRWSTKDARQTKESNDKRGLSRVIVFIIWFYLTNISYPRIQSSTAKQNEGQTPNSSFSARAQSTADKKLGKWGGRDYVVFIITWLIVLEHNIKTAKNWPYIYLYSWTNLKTKQVVDNTWKCAWYLTLYKGIQSNNLGFSKRAWWSMGFNNLTSI